MSEKLKPCPFCGGEAYLEPASDTPMTENMPSVQPEQKTGRWIMHISDLFPAESTMECSNCKHEQPLIIDDRYCPNCGAKMEGEE